MLRCRNEDGMTDLSADGCCDPSCREGQEKGFVGPRDSASVLALPVAPFSPSRHSWDQGAA
jgi:hypothetical protein